MLKTLFSRLTQRTIRAPTRCRGYVRPGSGHADVLAGLGLPATDAHDLPDSPQTFSDGAQYRVEIPSTEGVAAIRAVVEEAKRYSVPVHRVSQGTGIFLMTDNEIKDMLRIGYDNNMEVCLFVGPRNAWDISATARTDAGRNIAGHRGMDQLNYGLDDVKRGCDLGLRSILVGDFGLLFAVKELKKAGNLPKDLVCKISVQIGPANPATAQVLENLGATTLNPPTDLTLAQLAGLRQATTAPLDIYVEAPDNFGGFVRHFEIPDMVRCCAPMYVKLGLRNSPDIYPSGSHIENLTVSLSRERVRRARIALDMLDRYYPEATMTAVTSCPEDLGIPVIN